jgi:hypothetical protein
VFGMAGSEGGGGGVGRLSPPTSRSPFRSPAPLINQQRDPLSHLLPLTSLFPGWFLSRMTCAPTLRSMEQAARQSLKKSGGGVGGWRVYDGAGGGAAVRGSGAGEEQQRLSGKRQLIAGHLRSAAAALPGRAGSQAAPG